MKHGSWLKALLLVFLACALSGGARGETLQSGYPGAMAEQQQLVAEWLQGLQQGQGSAEGLQLAQTALKANGPEQRAALRSALLACQRDKDRLGMAITGSLLQGYSPLGDPDHQLASRLAFESLDGRWSNLRGLAGFNLAAEQYAAGQYADAIATVESALKVDAYAGPLDATLQGDLLLILARTQARTGLADRARENLRLCKQAWKEGDPERMLRAGLIEVEILSAAGAYSEALEVALAMRPQLTDPGHQEDRLRNELAIATFLQAEGRVSQAIQATRSILDECGASQRLQSLELDALNQLAGFLIQAGEDEEAELALERVLAASPMNTQPWRGRAVRFQLAQLYIRHRRLARAEGLLKEALSVSGTQQDHGWQVTLQMSLAGVLWDGGKLDESILHFRALVEKTLPPTVRAQGLASIEKAMSRWKQGDYPASLEAYQVLLDLLSRNGAAKTAATLYWNLSTVYHRLGDAEQESACLRRVLEAVEKGASPGSQPAALKRLVELELARRNLPAARAHFEKLTALGSTFLENPLLEAHYRMLLGLVREAEGQPEEAERACREAIRLWERAQSQALYAGGEASALGIGFDLSAASDGLAGLLLAHNRVEEAWVEVEARRRRLLRAVRARQVLASASERERLRELYGRLSHARGLLRTKPSPELERQIAALEQETSALEAAMDRQARALDGESRPSPKDVLAGLPPRTAILQYVVMKNGVWAFVLANGTLSATRLQGLESKAELERRVTALIRTLTRDRSQLPTVPLTELSQLLVHPVEERLRGATCVEIVQDGPLCLVPFELLSDAAGRPLLDLYTLAYLDSAREACDLTTSYHPRSALVIGGPNFALRGAPVAVRGSLRSGLWKDWPALPGSSREAQEIATALGVTALVEDRASEANFKKGVAEAELIHVATHGYAGPGEPESSHPFQLSFSEEFGTVSERNPLNDCGLIFAGANETGDGVDDGNLTGLEVLGLDLRKARLVVLSACSTARGDIRDSEGVYGLRRAFRVAGARELILSLWRVEDDATQQLMTTFYRHLLSGQSPAQALRLAKQSLRDDARFSHPAYWAAFQYVAGGRPQEGAAGRRR